MHARSFSVRFVIGVVALVLAGCGPGQIAPASQPPAAVAGPMLTASPLPLVKATFTDGERMVYVDSGLVKVGIDKDWGGAIREILYDGQNVINNYDGGRLAGAAFYDSARGPASNKPNDTGWNPTPSDMYSHTNHPLAVSFEGDTLYIKTRQIQWYPDDKGGGPDKPVPTDIIVETWLSFLGDPHTLHIRYKLTNEGQDAHALASQEFPFVYVRDPYNTFVSYTGQAPWTNDKVYLSEIPLSSSSNHMVVATEGWAGFVDDDDEGLVLWAPQNTNNFTYQYLKNVEPDENSTLYLLPRAFFEIGPGDTRQTDVFMILDRWQEARELLYRLRENQHLPDVLPPMGDIGAHPPGETVSGVYDIDGWAIDNTQVRAVEIRVDGKTIGKASYGSPRPDVDHDYPGQPGAPNFGLSYKLDTMALPNGPHTLEVAAVDTSGNTSVLIPGLVTITVNN